MVEVRWEKDIGREYSRSTYMGEFYGLLEERVEDERRW
jgi:hypothetical protein